ncbi:Psy2 protein [Saccharomycopsis crataegensis]|uniref:Psy2 protein n=1 Tax=Saccharomycopsis crataegensis TaxID=43959 RepID=A0AAV5QV01_9ASCO|nr:Psy2 protein [Saccharomycopsis crataegensis]
MEDDQDKAFQYQDQSEPTDLPSICQKINEKQTPKRVKLYYLIDEAWADEGTGYCIGSIEDNKDAYLVIENEEKQNDILLKAQIFGNTQYQKQQETLIVWTDANGVDIAISFQESEGCTLLCEFIISVQKYLENKISLVAILAGEEAGVTEIICGPIEYPTNPTMDPDNLNYICSILSINGNSMAGREEIAKFLAINATFLTDLIEVFRQSETEHNLRNLHRLCSIVKILISYNENGVFEVLFNDESYFLDIIGILEYDPEFPTYKSKFREYLQNDSKFKEIIPIEELKMKKLIISTFNFQFLKDVVLARLLDDPSVNSIATLIYFNQVEILKFLQEEENFLSNLFNLYNPESQTPQGTKRGGVKMIHQYVIISKSLQASQRSDFFKALVKKGLFKMIKFSLKDSQVDIRVIGTELIVAILEQDATLINGIGEIDNDKRTIEEINGQDEAVKKRKLDESNKSISIPSPEKNPPSEAKTSYSKILHQVKFKTKKEDTPIKFSSDMNLLLVLTDLLIEEVDQGLKAQAFCAIKSLLDPNNKVTPGAVVSFEKLNKVTFDTDAYINSFYEKVAPILFKPLVDLADWNGQAGTINRQVDELLILHLCDIITICAKDHRIEARSFIMEHRILEGINKLQMSRFASTAGDGKNQHQAPFKKNVQLAAIRCIKSIVSLNDEFYTRNIITNDLLGNSLRLLISTGGKLNLVHSTILDLLDLIIVGNQDLDDCVNYRLLIEYMFVKYRDLLETISNQSTSGKVIVEMCGGCLDNENEKLETKDSTKDQTNVDQRDNGDEKQKVLEAKGSPERKSKMRGLKKKVSLTNMRLRVNNNGKSKSHESEFESKDGIRGGDDGGNFEDEDVEMSVSPLSNVSEAGAQDGGKLIKVKSISKFKMNLTGKLSTSLNSISSGISSINEPSVNTDGDKGSFEQDPVDDNDDDDDDDDDDDSCAKPDDLPSGGDLMKGLFDKEVAKNEEGGNGGIIKASGVNNNENNSSSDEEKKQSLKGIIGKTLKFKR